MIHFEIPQTNESIIKVIGVGGGGGNAVNYMHELGIQGVDFIICNTDAQALAKSSIPYKIQLGPNLTQGLGAGANPKVGKQACEESVDDIKNILQENTKMAFITAGMGGGTGTGAAPIIAKICKELGILTVGIVTTPFAYEGRKRLTQAQEGINAMKEYVDTMLIISNDKLRQQYGDIPFSQAFSKADSVLSTAARCITDLITVEGSVNLDFNDVQTVMRNGGRAILGSAQANGEGRALSAVTQALDSPLLNDNDIIGAKWILLNITSGPEHEHTLDELEIIQEYVQEQSGNNCDIILGMGNDENLGDNISVTVIATGFNYMEFTPENQIEKVEIAKQKIVVDLHDEHAELKLDNASKGLDHSTEEVDNTSISSELAPRLTESSERDQVEQPMSQEPVQPKQYFDLEMPKPTTPAEEQIVNKPTSNIGNDDVEDMELVHKESQPSAIEKAGLERPWASSSYQMTEMEMEEERRFEEEKRKLELRAERLRARATANFTNKDDYLEEVPAYQRQNIDFEITNETTEEGFNSGYSVKSDEDDLSIGTSNTFLTGDRPD